MIACLRSSDAGPPPSPALTVTTSAYETPLGVAALSWSKTLLGLSVRVDLRLCFDEDDDVTERHVSFKVHPRLLFSRRGSKHFTFKSHTCDISWDLTRAKFVGGSPEPISGFFLSASVDGEVLLIAGDLFDTAFKKLKIKERNVDFALISRKEQIIMKDDSCYGTRVKFGGKERSIMIDLNGEMCLEVDGKQILQIRRLRWKFRGSEVVRLEGGDRIHISWDLHNWLFHKAGDQNAVGNNNSNNSSNALFVFRFVNGELEQGQFGKEKENEGYFGYLGRGNKNWSDTSSNGDNGKKCSSSSSNKKSNNKNRKKSLVKTSSSSSASSISSSTSSSVMEWASPEENELRNRRGFSLLISAWKR